MYKYTCISHHYFQIIYTIIRLTVSRRAHENIFLSSTFDFNNLNYFYQIVCKTNSNNNDSNNKNSHNNNNNNSNQNNAHI